MKLVQTLILCLLLSNASYPAQPCQEAADALAAIGLAPEDALDRLKRRMRISRHAGEKLFTQPNYARQVLLLIEAGDWLESTEGREVLENYARRIRETEVSIAKAISLYLEQAYLRNSQLENTNVDEIVRVALELIKPAEEVLQKSRILLARDLSPDKLLIDSLSEYQAAHPGQPMTFRWAFSRLFDTQIVPAGVDWIRPTHLVHYIDFIKNPRSSAYTDETLNLAERAIGGAVERRRILGRGTDDTYLNTFTAIMLAATQKIILRFATAVDARETLDKIVDECVEANYPYHPKKAQIKRYFSALHRAVLADFLPQEYTPVTAKQLYANFNATLAKHGKDLVSLYASEAQKKEKSPTLPSPSPSINPPTRMERMEAYRRAAEQKKREQALEEIGNAKSNPEAPPDRSSATTTPTPTPSIDIEELIATRSVNSSRAKAILDFFDLLRNDEKINVTRALSELLNRETRRLSDITSARIEKLAATEQLYEVKVQGVLNPIRIIFGIDPVDGPILLDAYYKKSSTDQNTRADRANTTWKRYND